MRAAAASSATAAGARRWRARSARRRCARSAAPLHASWVSTSGRRAPSPTQCCAAARRRRSASVRSVSSTSDGGGMPSASSCSGVSGSGARRHRAARQPPLERRRTSRPPAPRARWRGRRARSRARGCSRAAPARGRRTSQASSSVPPPACGSSGASTLSMTGPMGMPRSSSTLMSRASPPKRDLDVGEAVVEREPHVIGIAERERAADAVDGGVGVVRILRGQQVEQVALADAQDLGAPVDAAVRASTRPSRRCRRTARRATSARRWRGRAAATVASSGSPVEDALAGDVAAAHARARAG